MCSDFPQHRFEFGKELLNGIEVRAVWRQIEEYRARGLDCLLDANDFMDTGIVHEHNVSTLESWDKKLFDVGSKYFARHRAFEHKGCSNAVVAQRRDESNCFPVSMQHFLYEPLILRCPTVETHDRRGNGGFIEENEPPRIEVWLSPLQGPSFGSDVRAILFRGPQTFF